MAEELAGLLERIKSEGIDKAKAERNAIVAEAEKRAKDIVAEAEAKAKAIVADAEAQAKNIVNRGESAVKQSARDLMLALGDSMKARISAAVADAGAKALTPEFMASIVKELVAKFAANPNAEISVLTAVKDRDALNQALSAALKDSFKGQNKVLAAPGVEGGLQVSLNGDDLYFDFSLKALTELVSEYAGSRIAEILKDVADK